MRDDRPNRFADADDDFPFYDGRPVAISGPQWWFVMAAVALGLLILIAPILAFATPLGQMVPAILFCVIPLLGLAIVTPDHWTAPFRRVTVRDVAWMVGFALLNIVLTIGVGYAYTRIGEAQGNPAVAALADLSAYERSMFYVKTLPQLLGEELMTILPFLALMILLHARMKLSRTMAVSGAWLISAVFFALAHLPAYGWNLSHCLIVIGSARLVLTLAYMTTKNVWVSTGAHVLNDWALFTFTILAALPTEP